MGKELIICCIHDSMRVNQFYFEKCLILYIVQNELKLFTSLIFKITKQNLHKPILNGRIVMVDDHNIIKHKCIVQIDGA